LLLQLGHPLPPPSKAPIDAIIAERNEPLNNPPDTYPRKWDVIDATVHKDDVAVVFDHVERISGAALRLLRMVPVGRGGRIPRMSDFCRRLRC